MNYTAGLAALFGGSYQFGLSANTFGAPPAFVYDFSTRPIGVIEISFRSKYPVETPFFSNRVRIEAYNGAALVGRATLVNSDLSIPKNIAAVKTVSLDCAGESVSRVVVYVESAYAHPSFLAAAGYGIELTKFFIEDLSEGGGGSGGGVTPAENCNYTEDPATVCTYSEDSPATCAYSEEAATICTYSEG
jgi:hypothetical protein